MLFGRPARGFSLIELMITIAIVGLLAAIAYPSYLNYRLRSERGEGQHCLLEALRRAEGFYTRNGQYPQSMSQIFEVADNSYACGNDDQYLLSVNEATAACDPAFCIAMTATASGRQVKDGDLLLQYDFRTRTSTKLRLVDSQKKSWTES